MKGPLEMRRRMNNPYWKEDCSGNEVEEIGERKRNDKINFCVKESLFLFTAGGVTICLPHDRISHHFSVEILWRNSSPE